MSKRGLAFVDHWVSENINATGYAAEGDTSEARGHAEHCLAVAGKQGVTRQEIEEETGDLVEYMNGAIKSVNDAEVQRQIDNDRS